MRFTGTERSSGLPRRTADRAAQIREERVALGFADSGELGVFVGQAGRLGRVEQLGLLRRAGALVPGEAVEPAIFVTVEAGGRR